jgi:hypothetical protein
MVTKLNNVGNLKRGKADLEWQIKDHQRLLAGHTGHSVKGSSKNEVDARSLPLQLTLYKDDVVSPLSLSFSK